jgi:quercetin dioxygenase-like cupin family protein
LVKLFTDRAANGMNGGKALNQNSDPRAPATATRMIDDARVRVTRFDFEPGAETGWHTHGLDYVITALTDCHMALELPGGGLTRTTVPAGTSYRREAGVAHNVINDGDAAMSFVEVELK